jgi:hypothetical protein
MDEQGFDFRPGERRDPKPFEPPPWEKAAFEELRQKLPQPSEKTEVPDGGEQTQTTPPIGLAGGTTNARPASSDEATGTTAAVDDAMVIEMLSELSAEEPAQPKGLFAVGFGAGLVLVAIGGVMIVWAMAAVLSSRQTGWVGQWSGAGLGIFGAFFVGMGVWMLYRTLKQRGVL